MYTPELFEMTWKANHAERVATSDRARVANAVTANQPVPSTIRAVWSLCRASLLAGHRRSRLQVHSVRDTAAMHLCQWFLPWLCVLFISTSFAYPINVILSAEASENSRGDYLTSAPDVYMGLGIEPEEGAQTPDELAAAQSVSSAAARR
jgi:hypothetical protein